MRRPRPTPALPAPALLSNRPFLAAVFLFLLIPFFVPIPLSLRQHPLIGHLGDQVHVPFLMALTLLFYWRGPLTGRLVGAALAGMVLGGSIEFIQILVGRACLLHDFYLDLAGIGLAVGLVIWKGHRRTEGLGLMVLMALILSTQLAFLPGLIMGSYHARQSFPVISDFEGPHEKSLWNNTYDSQVELARVDDAPDSAGTVLRLTSGPPSPWPGAEMGNFPPDWSGYAELILDARNITPGRATVPFSVRLDDFQSRRDRAWASNRFVATKKWQTFSVPLTDRQVNQGTRPLDRHDLAHLLIFLADKKDSTAIEVDNLRLR